MNIDGTPWRSIWLEDDGETVGIIDQTLLPHRFEVKVLRTLEDAAEAISVMRVRGAPLIGATAAYGLALALQADPSDAALEAACDALIAAWREQRRIAMAAPAKLAPLLARVSW